MLNNSLQKLNGLMPLESLRICPQNCHLSYPYLNHRALCPKGYVSQKYDERMNKTFCKLQATLSSDFRGSTIQTWMPHGVNQPSFTIVCDFCSCARDRASCVSVTPDIVTYCPCPGPAIIKMNHTSGRPKAHQVSERHINPMATEFPRKVYINIPKGTSIQRNPHGHGPMCWCRLNSYNTLKSILSYGKYVTKPT